MTRPRFLADMNISPKTVGALQQRGWDIIRVSEVLPMDAADDEILEFARASRRVVVTQDLDFSALLVLKGYSYPSLITLRLASSAPEIITRRLLDVLPGMGAGLEKGNVYVVDDTTVRASTPEKSLAEKAIEDILLLFGNTLKVARRRYHQLEILLDEEASKTITQSLKELDAGERIPIDEW